MSTDSMQQTETRIIPLAIELPVGLWRVFDQVESESGASISTYFHSILMTSLKDNLAEIIKIASLMRQMREKIK